MVERRLELAYGPRARLELTAEGARTTAALEVFDLGPSPEEEEP
jgi:hypothetical protein